MSLFAALRHYMAERVGLTRAFHGPRLAASPASTSSCAVLPSNRTQVLRTGFESHNPLRQIQKTPLSRGSLYLAERVGLQGTSCTLPFGFAALIQKRSRRFCRTHQPLRGSGFLHSHIRQIKNPPEGGLFIWRRGWDSNPRWAINPRRFSRPVHSTALSPLQKHVTNIETRRIQKNFAAYHPCPQAYDRLVEIV